MPDAIGRSLTVAADPATAFHCWVDEIDAWWPKSHAPSRDPACRIVLEPRAGGRFYERTVDGRETELGAVLTYDPPHRLAYHFYLGTDADHPTLVEIRFTPAADGTRIDVAHREGRAGADRWRGRKGGFANAWAEVLQHYQRSLNS